MVVDRDDYGYFHLWARLVVRRFLVGGQFVAGAAERFGSVGDFFQFGPELLDLALHAVDDAVLLFDVAFEVGLFDLKILD